VARSVFIVVIEMMVLLPPSCCSICGFCCYLCCCCGFCGCGSSSSPHVSTDEIRETGVKSGVGRSASVMAAMAFKKSPGFATRGLGKLRTPALAARHLRKVASPVAGKRSATKAKRGSGIKLPPVRDPRSSSRSRIDMKQQQRQQQQKLGRKVTMTLDCNAAVFDVNEDGYVSLVTEEGKLLGIEEGWKVHRVNGERIPHGKGWKVAMIRAYATSRTYDVVFERWKKEKKRKSDGCATPKGIQEGRSSGRAKIRSMFTRANTEKDTKTTGRSEPMPSLRPYDVSDDSCSPESDMRGILHVDPGLRAIENAAEGKAAAHQGGLPSRANTNQDKKMPLVTLVPFCALET